MNDYLTYLGALTLGASAVILVLLLLGRSTRRRYSARWRCLAWLLLALRMAVPLPLPAGQEAPNAPVQIQLPTVQDPVIYRAPTASAPPSAAPSSPTLNAAPVTGSPPSPAVTPPQNSSRPSSHAAAPQKQGFTLSLSQLLFALWLLGCGAVLLWNLFCHLRFRRWLRRWATPVSNPAVIQFYNGLGDQLKLASRPRLMACPGVTAPMLAGLLSPVILLPAGPMEGAALSFTLRHELTHFRRRDIWLKTLVLWVNALYWFNPLVWLMARAVEQDTELACDDSVLRTLPPEERPLYSRTIIDTVRRLQEGGDDAGQA